MSCNHNDIYKSKIADVWQCNECGVFFQPVTAVADEKRCFTNDKGTLHAYANKLEWEPKEEQKGCWNCDGKGEVLTPCGICKPPDSPQEKCTCEGSFVHPCHYCIRPVKVQTADGTRIGKDYYTKSEIDDLLSNARARMDLHDGRINGLAEISEGRGKVIDEMKSEEKEFRKELFKTLDCILTDTIKPKTVLPAWKRIIESLRSKYL